MKLALRLCAAFFLVTHGPLTYAQVGTKKIDLAVRLLHDGKYDLEIDVTNIGSDSIAIPNVDLPWAEALSLRLIESNLTLSIHDPAFPLAHFGKNRSVIKKDETLTGRMPLKSVFPTLDSILGANPDAKLYVVWIYKPKLFTLDESVVNFGILKLR